MKVGDIPNEVYNRRNQVHRLVEMEEMNLKNDENVHQSLIYEENQKPKVSQSEPVGFLARMFGMSKSKPEQKEEEYKPTELKDHYNLYDEDWFDAQRNIIQKSQETSTADGNNEIIHLICPDDTIEGLELQYGVPACRIRTYNNLQTNDIFYLKKLSIPNPTSDNKNKKSIWRNTCKNQKLDCFQMQFVNQKIKIVKLRCNQQNQIRFYLDMNNWNYMKATQEYLDDYKFELQQHKAKKVSTHKAQA